MSKENNNPENGAQTDEEITAILKRLSQLLDKSVSLDEAVDLAKKQTETTEDTLSDEQPADDAVPEPQETVIIPEEDTKPEDTQDEIKITAKETAEETDEVTITDDSDNGQLSFDFASEDDNSEKASHESHSAIEDSTEQVKSIFEFIKAEEPAQRSENDTVQAQEDVSEEAAEDFTDIKDNTSDAAPDSHEYISQAPEISLSPDSNDATENTAPDKITEEVTNTAPTEKPEEIKEENKAEHTADDDEDAELSKLIKNLEKAWADFEKENGTSDVTATIEEGEEESNEEKDNEVAATETEDATPTELSLGEAEELVISRSMLTSDINETKEEDNTLDEQLSDTDKIVENITGKPAGAPESSKIFDELLACFENHKIPDDFRFTETERNTESINLSDITDSLSTEEDVSIKEDSPSPKYPLEELTAEENNEDNTEEPPADESEEILFEETADSEEADEPFTPIEHDAPQEEDELFSKIFSDEKDERKNKEKDKKKWQKQGDGGSAILSGLFDWLEVIVLSAAFALILFTFVMRLAVVDGDSMNHTLHDKELLIISDLMYTPENNDIIVFTSPNYPEPIVKRVIATEGQTVDIDFATWTVTVDGIPLDEDYVNRVAGSMDDSDVTFPLTVEEGHVFVMGDNRNESLDSRNSRIGLVDVRNILGEVKIRLFPFDRFGKVD